MGKELIENNLMITNTKIKLRQRRQIYNKKSIIDYFLVNESQGPVKGEAEIGSDQYLVITEMKIMKEGKIDRRRRKLKEKIKVLN